MNWFLDVASAWRPATCQCVVLAAFSWVAACGGRARSTEVAAAGGAAAGGAAAGGAAAGSVTGALGGSEAVAGAAGMGGDEPDPGPPAQIAGRWGMFRFEDPVGVNIMQVGAQLSGRGCAAGAPPRPDIGEDFCGALTGTVTGQHASFGFTFELGGPVLYAADVTVSQDGQRMAGRFHGFAGDFPYPTAWLRVKDDQVYLERSPSTERSPLEGDYDLQLSDAAPDATAYVPGETYHASFSLGAISSDLGSFWSSEISDPNAGSPLRVGPVPTTDPSLPTSLSIDFDADGFTKLRAEMPSGEHYGFDVTRSQ